MDIKYGLFSCDSHAQLDRDSWTKRMSKDKWDDRIPQIVEIEENGQIVDRWMVNGKVRSEWVCNCPAAMEGGVARGYYPRRWEEVPKIVYDPAERLKALDDDRVDGEVLYPNGPVSNFAFLQADAAFELACVQAYNDGLAEWREVSDRYVPVAIIPYMNEIDVVVAEVERCVKRGHRGVVMLAEPAFTKKGLKRMNDPYWEPLWACCQELGIPMHWHGSSGLVQQLSLPKWDGFTRKEFHTVSTSRLCATPAQLIPNLIFSGILDRYPRLNWACAETGFGWVTYVLEASNHEWEQRRLWKVGI
jgi:predicted TIM-barrel fold metal-dependent hydrolase